MCICTTPEVQIEHAKSRSSSIKRTSARCVPYVNRSPSAFFAHSAVCVVGTRILLQNHSASYPTMQIHWLDGEFVDFATSRNVLVSCVCGLCSWIWLSFLRCSTFLQTKLQWAAGNSEWMLLLDSGETIEHVSRGDSLDSVLANSADDVCGYHLQQVWGDSTFFNIRLVRNNGEWRYVFPVHEYLTVAPPVKKKEKTKKPRRSYSSLYYENTKG